MNIQTIDKFGQTMAIIMTLTVSNLTVAAEDTSFTNFGGELNTVYVDASNKDDTNIKKKDKVSSGLQQGIESARKALLNEKCSALFGDLREDGFASPFELLDTYVKNNLTRGGKSDPSGIRFENEGVAAMLMYGAGSFKNSAGHLQTASVITINVDGFYFSGRIGDGRDVTSVEGGGFEGLDMAGIRGAVIIHELLHVVDRIPADLAAILKDGGKQSMANSQLVRRNCFPRATLRARFRG